MTEDEERRLQRANNNGFGVGLLVGLVVGWSATYWVLMS